jgi:murein DD-endopeptidase MepM/ murein hydrolase activator NlpD
MNLRDKFTLILIPNSQGVSRQMTVSRALVYSGALAVVLLLAAALYFSAEHFTDQVTSAELERLRAENAELSKKFEKMRWDLSEVEQRYADLVEKEVAVRTLFDLPEIDPEERQLGIGGPTPPAVAEMSPVEHEAYITEREIDRLLRLSDFELQNYQQIEEELVDLKDRLDHTPSIWPTKGWLSSGYGMRNDPFTGYRTMHHGIDVANRRGTPIIAAADGKVVSVRYNGSLGKMITIDHGYGFKTRYGHLHESKVKVGQKVKRGDVIASMGSSGYSTGPHLHYEVLRNGKSLNPTKYALNDM